MLVLLLALLIPGAAASTATQPGYIVVGVAPVAQFGAHYAFATVPTKVNFVDDSLGSTPMTYLWDFGDGSTSTEQNPSHMYTQRGMFTAKLTVTNDFGTSTEIKKDYISIGLGPKADFAATPTSGNVPMAVTFTDKSQGQVTTWQWDFGDGKSSSEKDPVHTYWTAGVYNVILTVSNEYGSSDLRKDSFITVVGPLTSKFSPNPSFGKAPLLVKFTDRSIGTPTSWKWDFGDGATSTEQNPVHTFTTGGAFDVKLEIARGAETATSTQIVNIGGVPVADFIGAPTSVNVGETIAFTDKSSNSPNQWAWDFGDTKTLTTQNPSYAYQLKGIYTVSLTATNDNGKDTETKVSYINVGMGPQADFRVVIAPFELNKVPMTVTFVDQSARLPTSWVWTFGDGQTSAEQNPVHIYTKEGSYNVGLTVRNNFGADTKVMTGIVTVGKGPAVDFTADKTTVGVGRLVSFTDLSGNSPTTWVWEFGDGSVGMGSKPDHVYQKTGVYDVTLTASNPAVSNSRTKNQYITVLNIPRADFTADKTRGGAPMNVLFMDQSIGEPTVWNWDFGDGAKSTEKNPNHIYTSLGSYTVSLTVSNVNGQDTTSKAGFIVTTLAPVANFKVDQRIGKAPFIVQFKDLSTNNPTKWSWTFGDGTTSSEQNPRHIYPQEGAYDVRLTASNDFGSDTAYKTGTETVTIVPTTVPQTVVVTQAPTIIQTTAPTVAPTTKASMSPIVAVIGTIMGLLLVIAVAPRK
ncbi:MAG: PKD domain-containing protein [Methanomicrobiales archaeon]